MPNGTLLLMLVLIEIEIKHTDMLETQVQITPNLKTTLKYISQTPGVSGRK